MYKEMKKIVEVRNKHGNGDEFPDFADLFFFFGIKNVRVGGKILGSVGRSETHLFFFLALLLDSKRVPGQIAPTFNKITPLQKHPTFS
jgi:hypothetical protein